MKIYAIALLTLFLSACSPKLEPLDKSQTIMAFGDSLTYGYGVTPELSYPSQLEKITNYTIINEGKNGDTASAGKERLKTAVQEHKPAVVILGLGGNDMLRRNATNLEKDLKDMILYLKAKNIQVVLLAEPEPTMLASTLGVSDAAVYERVADDEKILLLDNIYAKYLSKAEYRSDLIHLNQAGYRLVAEDISKKLKKSGLLDF